MPDIIERYQKGDAVAKIAHDYRVSYGTIRKKLIDAGVYSPRPYNKSKKKARNYDTPDKTVDFTKRRKGNKMYSDVVYCRPEKVRNQMIYNNTTKYTFLQYTRIIMRWGQLELGYKKLDLELLLFIYPLGIFSRNDFRDQCRMVGYVYLNKWKKYIREGTIVEWRKKRPNQRALYTLSESTKRIISKMHKMYVGEIDISENTKGYKLMKKKTTGPEKYFLNAIKTMSKNNRALRENRQ